MPSGSWLLRALRPLLAAFVLVLPASGQMGARNPEMTGIWHPSVGVGGIYALTGPKGERAQVEITIVGKEDVNGKTGYWLETASSAPNGGEVYFKDLMITVNEGLAYAKRIKQVPGQDAIEFDMNVNSGKRMTTPSDIREEAERIGSETISVPAGTFACQHYRLRSGSGDVWLSDKVPPWGLVEMLFKNENQPLEFRTDGKGAPNNPNSAGGKDSSIVLTKIVAAAKDHIIGTPTKMKPIN